MNIRTILTAVLLTFSLPVSSLALTDDDLTPAALAGKTLTFTIGSGIAPLATFGVWTGTFGTSPGNAFTLTGVSGGTVNSNATWTYNGYVGGHAYTINPFIPGKGSSTLTLWISEGNPRFYVDLGSEGSTQFGGFTIGSTAVGAPEISVLNAKGDPLEDAVGKTRFGSARVGQSGTTVSFTIKNTGKEKLTRLSVSPTGKDFVVPPLTVTSLAPGKTTKLKVTFKPTDDGTRSAVIKITSNDADESPFRIKVTGMGTVK